MSDQIPPAYQPPASPGAYPPPAAPAYGAPPAAQKTNVMAILSLVFAFVFSILGVVFGHIALNQIKHTGEGGRGLAMAGLIIGYTFVALGVLWFILVIVGIGISASRHY